VTGKKDESTLRLAVGDIAGLIRVRNSDDAEVVIAVEVQAKVCCGFEILEHSLCYGHIAGEWMGIVSAESSNCIRIYLAALLVLRTSTIRRLLDSA